MDATIRKHMPKSAKDLKPNRTHAFHGVIMVLGWVAPPVAVLVRFGVGWDLVLNTILTICGYIPGHAHKCYIQNIRNNKNHKRTPKWAVRAGLVKMKDPRAGRHQWATRYDERVGGGGGDTDSLRSNSWDGRGAEPERRAKPLNTRRKHRHTLSPWDDYVDEDEVEGGEPGDGLYRTESRRFDPPSRTSTSSRPTEPVADPLTNEQFYPQPVAAPLRATPTGGKKKFGSALLKNRSRYEQPFDTTDAASSRTRGSDGFQDDFEREINGGAQQSAAYSSSRAGGSAGRFDTFEAEGPEDAWGSARPANGSSRAPLRPQKTGRAEETDGDLFKHTF
ncbi:hypothetical protein BMF94_6766 [Rhodotorula taiwanensis]|uniref:Uncharacterized protein n=1 Tax=Rhodotorula taiwanensis TaxID=741276 RepID=A0A2S5B076_9BASI|nr:hypothetical protein BMF94_6766 [Rhodotorula taiwanensis]